MSRRRRSVSSRRTWAIILGAFLILSGSVLGIVAAYTLPTQTIAGDTYNINLVVVPYVAGNMCLSDSIGPHCTGTSLLVHVYQGDGISIQATPIGGFTFDHWTSSSPYYVVPSNNPNPLVYASTNGAVTFTAYFTGGPITVTTRTEQTYTSTVTSAVTSTPTTTAPNTIPTLTFSPTQLVSGTQFTYTIGNTQSGHVYEVNVYRQGSIQLGQLDFVAIGQTSGSYSHTGTFSSSITYVGSGWVQVKDDNTQQFSNVVAVTIGSTATTTQSTTTSTGASTTQTSTVSSTVTSTSTNPQPSTWSPQLIAIILAIAVVIIGVITFAYGLATRRK